MYSSEIQNLTSLSLRNLVISFLSLFFASLDPTSLHKYDNVTCIRLNGTVYVKHFWKMTSTLSMLTLWTNGRKQEISLSPELPI